MDGTANIRFYDPSQPLSATNPSPTNIPTLGGSGGLTLMPNINGGTLCPTFYTVANGTYWYWSGATWVNTGHSCGTGPAVNIAGCGSTIYNLVGSNGQIYSYNGTGNGTLLTTIAGFAGGGPYDLVTDCNCNFYVLRTATPNQALSLYNSAGVLQSTFALVGMPNTSSGGGFAIIGNTIYVHNGTFYTGTITGGTVTFTVANPGWTGNGPGDFASCPVCTTTPAQSTIAASLSGGGPLSCIVTTVNIAATTTVSPVNYLWTGPGIVGPATGSVIVANSPGVYNCALSTTGCDQVVFSYTLSSITSSILPAITPSGNICTNNTGTIQLTVSPTTSVNTILWAGPGIVSSATQSAVITNAIGVYTVTVNNSFNGCVTTDTVNISQTPTVSIVLSSNSLCAQAFNGSPNTITLTALGASNYTLFTSSNFTTTAPLGSITPCFPTAPYSNSLSIASATLIGKTGFCANTAIANFSIFPNPQLLVSPNPASVCLGNIQSFSVSGAASYTWSGPAGLNTYSSSYVIANTSVTSIYSVIGTNQGCKSATQNATLNILPIPIISITPATNTVCLGNSALLTAGGNANTYSWTPSVFLSGTAGFTVNATPPTTRTYTLIGTLNSCTSIATAVVNVVNPPILSLALNTNTVCEYNYNGSANTITAIPSGANSYTLLNGTNYTAQSITGNNFQITPIGAQSTAPSVATATMVGVISVCSVTLTKTFTIIPNPLLSVSPSATNICPGKNQIFHVIGANTYSWVPSSDLNTLSGNIVLATPNLSNIYSVIGTSVGCKSNNHTANLTVLPIPFLSIAPSSPTICAGSAVHLIASGNASFYNWYPSAGLSATSGTNVIASPLTTQIYTVVGTLNTCTNSAVSTVSAIVVPVLTATASQYTVCAGSNTTLKAFGANEFYWSPSQHLNYPAGNIVTASPDQNTTYTINGFNGICTGSTTIYIETVPLPNMQIISSENQICLGSTLSIAAKGAQTYTWSPALGLSATTGSLVDASPPSSVDYTVVGTISNGTISCHQQMGYSVLVSPLTQAHVSNSVAICKGDKTTLVASGGNVYNWAPNFGLNITNRSGVVASPSVSTIYTVNVSQNSFCSNTVTVLVEVNPKPQIFAGRDSIYNLDEAIILNASGTGTITWISGEGVLCKVCPTTAVKIDRDECFVAEAVNDFGCKVQDKICIQVTSEFGVYIPNTFTPNDDKINDIFYVYANNIFNFNLEIFDRWGTNLFSSKDQSIGWDGTYKAKLCKNDTYIYKVSFKGLNGKSYTRNGYVSLMK